MSEGNIDNGGTIVKAKAEIPRLRGLQNPDPFAAITIIMNIANTAPPIKPPATPRPRSRALRRGSVVIRPGEGA
jgi:hypothetical protein